MYHDVALWQFGGGHDDSSRGGAFTKSPASENTLTQPRERTQLPGSGRGAGRGLWGWSPTRSCRAPPRLSEHLCISLLQTQLPGCQGPRPQSGMVAQHVSQACPSAKRLHMRYSLRTYTHPVEKPPHRFSEDDAKAREVAGSKKHGAGSSLEHFPNLAPTPNSPSDFTGHCIIPQAKPISTANGGGDFVPGPHCGVQLVLEVTRDVRKEREGGQGTVPREVRKEFLAAPSHCAPTRAAALWARDQAHRAR